MSHALLSHLQHFLRNKANQLPTLLLIFAAGVSSIASGQTVEFTQSAKGTNKVTVQVPLASYPGRGINLPVSLTYSSDVWRIGYISSPYDNVWGSNIRRSVTEAIYAEHSTAGWRTSLDIPRIEWPKLTDRYSFNGKPNSSYSANYTYRVARVYVHMPDGSRHELRKSDQAYLDPNYVDVYGTFYAVDGSRMRYDSTGQNTGTLYLPDGSRYILGSGTIQFIDRNGNTLTYNLNNRQWTDTMGRVIGMPFPTDPQATDYSYVLPGINGSNVTYVFKFRALSNALSPGSPSQRPAGDYYLPNPSQPPSDWNGNNFPQATGAASLFSSGYSNMESESSYSYVVGRGQSGSSAFNPIVLTEIVLPNGQSYKFSYNNYGELDKVIYPTGGYQRYQYVQVPTLGQSSVPYDQGARGINSRWVSANGTGTDEVQWSYEIVKSPAYRVTVTAPNGLRSETYLRTASTASDTFGHEDATGGSVYEERVYAPASEGGAMLRRTLIDYQAGTAIFSRPSPGTGTYTASRNPRPIRTVSLFLDTGGSALTASATSQYHTGYEFSVGVDLGSTSEYAYTTIDQTTAQSGAISSMPYGALVRSTDFAYLTSDANYRNRNLLGLLTAKVVKNAAGRVNLKSCV